jgi:hypothetical protein
VQARRPDTLARQRGKSRRHTEHAGPGTGAGRSPSSAPERLGPLRHRGPWIVLVALVVGAIVLVAALAGRDGGGELEQRTAELEEQEAAREAEQVGELTDIAVTVHGELLPVLAELHDVLPVEGPPGEPATHADLDGWRVAVDGARTEFGDPPSASTEVNTARGGLVLAVDLLGSSLTAYESALADDAGERPRLEGLAADLRRNAVDAWSVAATQLDLLNIDAGNGHVHLYLPVRPGEDVADPLGHD